MTSSIQLTKGYIAIVDDVEYDRINQFKWFANLNSRGRVDARRKVYKSKGKQGNYMMAAFVLNEKPGTLVDHINGNTLDNRRDNLRVATTAQNSQNKRGARSDSETGIRGIGVTRSYYKDKQYVYYIAVVTLNGKDYTKTFPYTNTGLTDATRWVKEKRRELMPYCVEDIEDRTYDF